jgi:hypothetical protein
MKLELTSAALPTLLTDCVIVGHARKADVVWTRHEWFAICAHMMNDNPPNFFLMPFRDEKNQPHYKKAFKADVRKRIPWAWETMTGKATSPASVAFYPTNAEGKSRWAGMDFDAHDGDITRARDFAWKAFAVLLRQPELFIALTTSAGNSERCGFHVYIFSRDFHSREDWTRLLKQVAAQIGALIQDGVCEIFPNESRGLPKPFSAPGVWNPKTGDCGLILHQALSECVAALPYGREREGIALSVLCELRRKEKASSQNSGVFRGEHGEWKDIFAITAQGTRHHKLTKLVGTAFFQAGRNIARKNGELQHGEATPKPNAELQEHLVEFDEAWAGMERKWLAGLSVAERQKYDGLTTQTERDAFRIIRNWSQTGAHEFKIRCQSLGDRVGISLKGASKLRRRFCRAGILRETKRYVPNKFCARFLWTGGAEAKRQQGTLVTPAWSDPGDAGLVRPSAKGRSSSIRPRFENQWK